MTEITLPSILPQPQPDGAFSDQDARLALEIVSGLSPIAEVLTRYGLNAAQMQAKLANAGFQELLKATKTAWSSDLNAKERIRLKSQHIIEDSLPTVHQLIRDSKLGATARLEAFKSLTKVAGVEEKDTSQTGGKFTLNINVGDRPVTIEGGTHKSSSSDDGFDVLEETGE